MFKHGIIFVAIALGLFKFMSNYNQTPNASSKLPPNHGSTQAVPFVVADLPGKGKGLVATRDIQVRSGEEVPAKLLTVLLVRTTPHSKESY